MATAERILTLARNELGYRESPAKSNRTKYGKWYKLDGKPWCMMFVMWIFNQAGLSALLPVRTASCAEFMKAAKKAGNWHKRSDLKPGDIVIFDFPGNSSHAEHTGIVEEVVDDGERVMTIEGNTSMGNDANGGAVMRRKRKRSLIAGAYRPAYDAERGEEDESPDASKPIEDPETEKALYGEPEPESALYGEPESALYGEPEAAETGPKVGDLVTFKGQSQFSGPYDDAEAIPARPCAARADAYCPGTAHPFRLYGDGIEGWADWNDVEILNRDEDDAEASETLSLDETAFLAEISARPSLRVRNGPGVQYSHLRSLSAGTVVTVVSERNGWYKLSDGGWVSARYIRKL